MSNDGKEIAKKILGFVGGILFFASFIPWIFFGFCALYGVSENFFGGANIYGLKALCCMFEWFLAIPVIEICLFIEIFYVIFFVRKAGKGLKIASIVCAAVSILAMLIPCCIWGVKDHKRIKEYEPDLREYLKETYGETMSREAKISLKYYDEPTFNLETPVLPDGHITEISYRDYEDDYMEFVANDYCALVDGFSDDFDNYLDKELGLPENMHMDAHVEAIDFGDYHYGDDYTELFPRTEYMAGRMNVELEEFTYDDLLNIPKTIYEEYVPLFEDKVPGSIIILVTHEGQNFCTIQVDMPSEGNHNRAIAVFTVSNNYKEYKDIDGYVFIDEIGKDVVHME